jgi:hypothetical protein
METRGRGDAGMWRRGDVETRGRGEINGLALYACQNFKKLHVSSTEESKIQQDRQGSQHLKIAILLILSLLQKSFNVIPAKPAPEVSSPGAGIQVFQGLPDPGYHRGDGFVEFCKRLSCLSFSLLDRTMPRLCFEKAWWAALRLDRHPTYGSFHRFGYPSGT